MSNETLSTETKLTPELKAKWVEALRSGDYEQGHEYLCRRSFVDEDSKCYCCLGVLALVAGTELKRLLGHATLDEVDRRDLLGEWGDPQRNDFDPGKPETHSTIQRKLAAMNDNGRSFDDIADWIEANL